MMICTQKDICKCGCVVLYSFIVRSTWWLFFLKWWLFHPSINKRMFSLFTPGSISKETFAYSSSDAFVREQAHADDRDITVSNNEKAMEASLEVTFGALSSRYSRSLALCGQGITQLSENIGLANQQRIKSIFLCCNR